MLAKLKTRWKQTKKLLNRKISFNPKKTALGAAAVALLAYQILSPKIIRPSTPEEFASVTVMVTNLEENSGGSGVILESHPSYSIILTNRHVCGVAQYGGLVKRGNEKYLIADMKRSTQHDLCEIRVRNNLHVNTAIAKHAPAEYDNGTISGHPALLPHVLYKGQFGGRMHIEIMTGLRKCTAEDLKGADFETLLMCEVMGGLPVIETLDTQLMTGLILGGNSGSAVYNSDGEISGLVFAGMGKGFSFAFIVPQEYVWAFVKEEALTMEWARPEIQ